MKNIKILVLTLLISVGCKAQQIVNIHTFNQGSYSGKYFKDLDNHYDVFVGTWENTTGNMTFRVVLHKTERMPIGSPTEYYMDRIHGSFLMIENVGTRNEREIYNSVRYFPQSGQTSENVIIGGSRDGVSMGSFIEDTTISNTIIPSGILRGQMTLEILNLNNTPLQARWKVFRKGLSLQGVEFNVPIDIILTKQ